MHGVVSDTYAYAAQGGLAMVGGVVFIATLLTGVFFTQETVTFLSNAGIIDASFGKPLSFAFGALLTTTATSGVLSATSALTHRLWSVM